ncbi:MAG: transcription antitermination factor NusB [Betaproteobacteria bacterium]|nr:transcription antitermination factor NusB [Betaproteobacteria bacterium]
MKSARRRSRELALQGLYAWQVAHSPVADIVAQLEQSSGFEKADRDYFQALLGGAVNAAEELLALLAPALDRRAEELSPVERGILLLAAHELRSIPEVPYKVVIDEAVELAKAFGGTDGYKYVNGVLDKLAKSLRPA